MLEKLNKYNSVLLIFICIITYAHLLFSGDLAWYTKESMYSSGLFLNAVVIYNLTRRRHYRVQQLGTLYLCFWFTRFIFHFADRILLDCCNIDLATETKYILLSISALFFISSYFIMNKLEKQWNKKTENNKKDL